MTDHIKGADFSWQGTT